MSSIFKQSLEKLKSFDSTVIKELNDWETAELKSIRNDYLKWISFMDTFIPTDLAQESFQDEARKIGSGQKINIENYLQTRTKIKALQSKIRPFCRSLLKKTRINENMMLSSVTGTILGGLLGYFFAPSIPAVGVFLSGGLICGLSYGYLHMSYKVRKLFNWLRIILKVLAYADTLLQYVISVLEGTADRSDKFVSDLEELHALCVAGYLDVY